DRASGLGGAGQEGRGADPRPQLEGPAAGGLALARDLRRSLHPHRRRRFRPGRDRLARLWPARHLRRGRRRHYRLQVHLRRDARGAGREDPADAARPEADGQDEPVMLSWLRRKSPPPRRFAVRARELILALLLFAAPALAIGVDEPLPDPAQEQRAREISKSLRCLVCQNQSIEDSNATLAKDLRRIVRERVQAGDSDDQVREYLVARYGDWVLLKPPFNVRTAALWIGP